MYLKPCKKCCEIKPLSDFPPHKKMADGHLNMCRSCRRKYVNEHRKTPSGIAMRQREKQYPEVKKRYKKSEKGKLANSKYKTSSEKMSSRNAVHYALKIGKLVKEPCFVCGNFETHGHHSSYAPDMKLAVTWLCQIHHNELHIEHSGYKSWK